MSADLAKVAEAPRYNVQLVPGLRMVVKSFRNPEYQEAWKP